MIEIEEIIYIKSLLHIKDMGNAVISTYGYDSIRGIFKSLYKEHWNEEAKYALKNVYVGKAAGVVQANREMLK